MSLLILYLRNSCGAIEHSECQRSPAFGFSSFSSFFTSNFSSLMPNFSRLACCSARAFSTNSWDGVWYSPRSTLCEVPMAFQVQKWINFQNQQLNCLELVVRCRKLTCKESGRLLSNLFLFVGDCTQVWRRTDLRRFQELTKPLRLQTYGEKQHHNYDIYIYITILRSICCWLLLVCVARMM